MSKNETMGNGLVFVNGKRDLRLNVTVNIFVSLLFFVLAEKWEMMIKRQGFH